jgi:hypothetical protein
MEKLSVKQTQASRQRRKGAQASLACEGVYLTDEEIALFEHMEKERMPFEQRMEYIKDYF